MKKALKISWTIFLMGLFFLQFRFGLFDLTLLEDITNKVNNWEFSYESINRSTEIDGVTWTVESESINGEGEYYYNVWKEENNNKLVVQSFYLNTRSFGLKENGLGGVNITYKEAGERITIVLDRDGQVVEK